MKNFVRSIVVVFCLISLLSPFLSAQSVDEIFNRFIKKYQTYQGTTIPYYLFKPANYTPATHFPLVLCLHGSGERGDNPSAVKNNSMATVWARDSNQARWPCFILVPQCPTNGWWPDVNLILTVNNIVDSLRSEFSLDTNRLYITGLSMGGYGTWSTIAYFPHKYAAAVPMSGGGDPSTATLIKHIPIWNFHGAQDGTVNVSASRQMISALENTGCTIVYTNCHNGDCTGLSDSALADKIKSGAKKLYTEYQYGGHLIWDQAYNTALLSSWLFAQSTGQISSSIDQEPIHVLPEEPALSQNFPNPFNPSTEIRFSVENSCHVNLCVYDILGRDVVTLIDEKKSAGMYSVTFNAHNIPSGVYFYRIKAGNFASVKKLMVVK